MKLSQTGIAAVTDRFQKNTDIYLVIELDQDQLKHIGGGKVQATPITAAKVIDKATPLLASSLT